MIPQENKIAITVENLEQKVGDKTILSEISFQIRSGERVGIFGLRASGKTSLVNILAGVDAFTSGEVHVLGSKLPKEQKFKQNIGLVTQKASLFQDLRAGENLDYIAVLKNTDLKNVKPVIERLELTEYLKKPVSVLEYGVFQRLSLACALIGTPSLLITDEPFNDIDLYSRKLILNELQIFKEKGGTCIWAYSDINLSAYMDRVLWLEDGRIKTMSTENALERWYAEVINLEMQPKGKRNG